MLQKRLYTLLWCLLVLLVLCGLYFAAESSLSERPPRTSNSHAHRLAISAPRAGEELPVFKVQRGDVVSLMIDSDLPGEANVHGYERRIDLHPGGRVTLSFTATEAGVFPVHLHQEMYPGKTNSPLTHRQIAILEVHPQ